jgi:pyridoxal biosynthesis lyase PdxS
VKLPVPKLNAGGVGSAIPADADPPIQLGTELAFEGSVIFNRALLKNTRK